MTHEFDGKKYEKASAHQKEWGRRLISELNLKGVERVLDLGCGDGSLTRLIADLLPEGEVLGIDASQGMIETAIPKERPNLRFRKLDINHIDFADQFDLVFSNATLHWVKDHQRLLRNVHRALRTTGRLRFNFAGDSNCSHLFAVVREAMTHAEYRPFFVGFQWPWYMPPLTEYQVLAGSSGFRGVRVWGENADRYFPNEEAMVRWIDQPSLVPFLAQVADEAKASFRNFVLTRMIEETKQDDGRCFETFRRINLAAVK